MTLFLTILTEILTLWKCNVLCSIILLEWKQHTKKKLLLHYAVFLIDLLVSLDKSKGSPYTLFFLIIYGDWYLNIKCWILVGCFILAWELPYELYTSVNVLTLLLDKKIHVYNWKHFFFVKINKSVNAKGRFLVIIYEYTLKYWDINYLLKCSFTSHL